MITLQSVFAARERIRGIAVQTPLVPAPSLSVDGRDVRLKLEICQPTTAFKLRGAASALTALSEKQREAGVVCASTGNAGRAVAYAAKMMGARATICMSKLVPQNKLDAIAALGAETVIIGDSQDDAQQEVWRLVKDEGMAEIPPFDHADVIAGQGTIALEILEQFSEVDTLIVQLSGGGLIAGIAMAAKTINPAIRVIGVSMERGAAMAASLKAGKPVEVREEKTLADSLGGGINLNNRYTFKMAQDFVDDVVLLTEEQIARAMAHLYWREGWVTEGAGAVGAAVLLDNLSDKVGRNVALVLSGKNVDMETFHQVVSKREGAHA